ncbi:MAG: serine O-acetyltransferase EpsC [Acidobacteriota bacterium]
MFEDIKAIKRNDPACKNVEFLLYPCLHAIVVHRYLAHPLYRLGVPFLPRLISQVMRILTGMEIHPGAKIGKGFFCDHGMGVVIGETSEIGENCVLFHGVTLGGTGKHTGKRHPTLGNDVFIGTHATILGPVTIGDGAKVGAESVIINRDVPAHCTVVGAPAVIVKKEGKSVHLPLPVSAYHLEDRREEENNLLQHPAGR